MEVQISRGGLTQVRCGSSDWCFCDLGTEGVVVRGSGGDLCRRNTVVGATMMRIWGGYWSSSEEMTANQEKVKVEQEGTAES